MAGAISLALRLHFEESMAHESGRPAIAGAGIRFCVAVLAALVATSCSSSSPADSNRDAAAAGGHAGNGTGGSKATGGAQGEGGRVGNGTGGSNATGGAQGQGGHVGTGGSGARDAGGGTYDAGSGDGPASVGFAAVKPIFATWCVRCHDPAHPIVPETSTFVTMDLTAAGAYGALVGKPAAEACGGVRVVPGDPAKSYLYRKVTEASPCDGSRMPAQGMLAIQTPLSPADIETIRAWIAGGAKP